MSGLIERTGIFAGDHRLQGLDLLDVGLPLHNLFTPWVRFCSILGSVPKAMSKELGARKFYDRKLLFKMMMVLQKLHSLSNNQAEDDVRDRLNFSVSWSLGWIRQ